MELFKLVLHKHYWLLVCFPYSLAFLQLKILQVTISWNVLILCLDTEQKVLL